MSESSQYNLDLPERERLMGERRTFDMLASIDMLRFDLQVYGEVLPETLERVMDEEMSYMAEGMNRPLRTEFTLKIIDGELSYFDRGEWRPYIGMLVTGYETAAKEAKQDRRKSFLAERAAGDLETGYRLRALRPGETYVWDSDFPEDAMKLYGETFVKRLGFQPARRMGFLYHALRNEDDTITMISQSVDRSNERAFAEARYTGMDGGDIDTMLEAYDAILTRQLGGYFYAGRRLDESKHQENAWTAMERHKDLKEYYAAHLITLAERDDLTRPGFEREKKKLTYSIWATFRRRLDRDILTGGRSEERTPASFAAIDQERNDAYRRALLEGAELIGCGGAISEEELEKLLLEADIDVALAVMFGEDHTIPSLLRCIECRRESPKEKVILASSWRCPHCAYEVDVCTGKVLHEANFRRDTISISEAAMSIVGLVLMREDVTIEA